MVVAFLKKKSLGHPMPLRGNMIEKSCPVSIKRQCELLSIHKSGLYYKPAEIPEEDLMLQRKIDEQYLKTPFYGAKRLREWLVGQGYNINIKKVRRLMQAVNWQTLYPSPNLSRGKDSDHKYPYLLKGLNVVHPNQVWAMDITYIPMAKGYMYLSAIIDLHSRYVLNWSVSNTMTSEWCVSVVNEAIAQYGRPSVFNTDQGSQFTSNVFVENLQKQGIHISMDGKGRAIDHIFIERFWRSIKYGDIYLKAYADGVELYKGVKEYIQFYNQERAHQSLAYKTPAQIYLSAA